MRTALLTIGTFDLFHVGHCDFLEACTWISDHVTVAVNPDAFVAEFKGRAPVVGVGDRLRVVRACRYVDAALIGSGAGSADAIEAWLRGVDAEHKVIAIGDDWARRDYLGQLGIDDDYLRRRGIMLVYVHSQNGLRSSELRERCRSL